MDAQRMLACAPAQLSHSTQRRDIVYTLARDVVAAHGAGADDARALRDGECSLVIVPAGEAPADGAIVGPVYRANDGDGLVAPTGMALVRFADGDRATDHGEELADAGYEIERELSYAPQAALVRACSGEIVDALRGLGRLERLPGVHDVEPQLLSEAARRA